MTRTFNLDQIKKALENIDITQAVGKVLLSQGIPAFSMLKNLNGCGNTSAVLTGSRGSEDRNY